MCGISGVVNKIPESVDNLISMTKIITHRGPDDEGYLLVDAENNTTAYGGNDTPDSVLRSDIIYCPKKIIDTDSHLKFSIGFGHRRLSIVDLSPAGHQPMSFLDGRYWIVLNGEIYNYPEIREELELLGHQFVSQTDTEVIMAAYHQWGIECQSRFIGMWAFVIYDRLLHELFISRDRFGIKPLYYWFSPNGSFYFSSEIKQFTVVDGWKATLNKSRAYDYLYHALTDHTDETMFNGVFIVKAGYYFKGTSDELLTSCQSGKINITPWYQINVGDYKEDFDSAKTIFYSKFEESVRLHLRSDVKVGSALSGGLDSSTIVSLINNILKEEGLENKQKTFSSCSYDKRYDEREWMDKVVAATNVDADFVYPQGEDIFKLTDKLIWYMDEPYQSQSAFLGNHVFRQAKEKDVIVLLNGQGADEYLSGYGAFRYLRQRALLKAFKFRILKNEKLAGVTILKMAGTMILESLSSNLFFELVSKKSHYRRLNKIVSQKVLLSNVVTSIHRNSYNVTDYKEISKHQLFSNPLQRYLRWEDRNSMAHSVEARVPFLDHRLVEFSLSLPLDYLDGPDQPKKILSESMKGILNEDVRTRKDKKGFITPEQNWFMVEYRKQFLNMLEENVKFSNGIINFEEARSYFVKVQDGKVPFDYTYWRILLFCIWMRVFKVELT